MSALALAALVYLLAPEPTTSFAPALLSSSTESAQGSPAPAAVVAALSAGFDDYEREQLAECMLEPVITAEGANRLFLLSPLPDGLVLVRPALEPYCHAFYGAHIFQYWLLDQRGPDSSWRVLFHSAADALEVLPATRGVDLLNTHCTGYGCDHVLLRFDGAGWTQGQCFFEPEGAARLDEVPCR